MKNLKYIFAILLVLFFSAALSWAKDEKSSKSDDKESTDKTEAIDEAATSVDDLMGDETPDVIKLGQMMKEGLFDPVKSKARRDNPFEPPMETQDENGLSGIEPLPPTPFVGPEFDIPPEKNLRDALDGIKLVGIMEIVEGTKIAILDFDGVRKSLKVGGSFPGPVDLILTEIGDDSVILETKDGSDKVWVGFSFASPK